jgi:D-aminopeptidase
LPPWLILRRTPRLELAKNKLIPSRVAPLDFEEKAIDAIFDDLNQCHLPGAAVGVAIGGRPVYRKAFGLANMELPVVLSTTTRMRLCSTTKHFTCLAYLLLCEQGRAAIDGPVRGYLPELHPVADSVTVRHLMTHTSGLYDAHALRYAFSGIEREVPTADLLSCYKELDTLNFAPGTSFSYNNGAYALLSTIIERVADESFEEFMSRTVFGPAGMHDTCVRRVMSGVLPNSALDHTRDVKGTFVKAHPTGASAGNGGIVSTVEDMLRWLSLLDQPSIGNPTTWKEMTTPYMLPNGVSTGYAFGLYLGDYRGARIVHHAGGSSGCNGQMLKVPEAGLDVQVLLNRDDISAIELANKIVDACLSGLRPRTSHTMKPVAGLYRSPTTGRVIQLLPNSPAGEAPDGPPQLASLDGADLPFAPDESGVLRPAGKLAYTNWAITLRGDQTAPSSIELREYGKSDVLEKADAATTQADHGLQGEYVSDVTQSRAVISPFQDRLRLTTTGPFGHAKFILEPLTDLTWRARSPIWPGIVRFESDGSGFDFSSYGMKAIRFRRRT